MKREESWKNRAGKYARMCVFGNPLTSGSKKWQIIASSLDFLSIFDLSLRDLGLTLRVPLL